MASKLNEPWKAMPGEILSIINKVPYLAPPTHDLSQYPLDEESLKHPSPPKAPNQANLDLDQHERSGLVKYLLLQAVRELDPSILPAGWCGDLDRRGNGVALRDLPRGVVLPLNNVANSNERQHLDSQSSWTRGNEQRLQRDIVGREYRRQEAAGESQLRWIHVHQQADNIERSVGADSNEGEQTPPEIGNFVNGNLSSRRSSFKMQSVTTGPPSEADIGSLNIRDPEWSFEEKSVKLANNAFLHPPHRNPSRGAGSSLTTSEHPSTRPIRPGSLRSLNSSCTVSDSASTRPLPPRSLNNASPSGSNTSLNRQRTSPASLAERRLQDDSVTAAAAIIRQAGLRHEDQKENKVVHTTNDGDFTEAIWSNMATSHSQKTDGGGSSFPVTRPDLFAIRGSNMFKDSGHSISPRSPMSFEREEQKPQLSTIAMLPPEARPSSSHATRPIFGEEGQKLKAYVSPFVADNDSGDFPGVKPDNQQRDGRVDKGKGKATLVPSSDLLPSRWPDSSIAAFVTSDHERLRYKFMSDIKDEEVLNFDELPPRPHHGLKYDYQQVLLDIAALAIDPRIRWRMQVELVRVSQIVSWMPSGSYSLFRNWEYAPAFSFSNKIADEPWYS